MPEDKKIIIDEDWKSQVQAEKEEAAQRQGGAPTETAAPSPPEQAGELPMPPASFELLLTTLATEALVALGQLPHPATGQAHVHRNQAKYLIDTIDMLREKTKGNLAPREQQIAESLLHQLRLLFVETAKLPPSPSDAQSKS